MSECGKCGAEIGKAAYCGCGWKRYAKSAANASELPRVKCCHDTCFIDAFCKIQTPTGWANFCHAHYDEYFKRSGDAYCASRGLVTRQQKIAYLKAKWPSFVKLREPGQDDEEIAV